MESNKEVKIESPSIDSQSQIQPGTVILLCDENNVKNQEKCLVESINSTSTPQTTKLTLSRKYGGTTYDFDQDTMFLIFLTESVKINWEESNNWEGLKITRRPWTKESILSKPTDKKVDSTKPSRLVDCLKIVDTSKENFIKLKYEEDIVEIEEQARTYTADYSVYCIQKINTSEYMFNDIGDIDKKIQLSSVKDIYLDATTQTVLGIKKIIDNDFKIVSINKEEIIANSSIPLLKDDSIYIVLNNGKRIVATVTNVA
jgi:hypothetical protein